MAGPRESVQGRAYSIWEDEGRPEGRDLEHWLQAERETAGEAGETVDEAAATAPDAASPESEGGRSAETGIEDAIERDEAADDPDGVGRATLDHSD
ncbi:MAG: DUF2934 domain-containing protein [Amaricoccus sp.]|uniref:DUF2934 domain-containing protein n=1 Tax=Amaricoccus sp. TaxID=1872485 RepID=UPI0039E37430